MPLVRVIRPLLGDRLRWYLTHRLGKRRYYRYLDHKVRGAWRPVDPGPHQPRELVLKTSVLNREEVAKWDNPNLYFTLGYGDVLYCLQVLDRFSFNLRTLGAVLELGVGSARMLRHLRCIDGVRLVGTDVNSECVEWCQRNVPGCEFYVNDVQPPLSFAEDESFDLVFAWSVFPHIPLELQRPWLEELRRVLRPGGFFLTTVLGSTHEKLMLTPEDREQLRREGHLTLTASDAKASLATQLAGSWDVFQTREQVLKAFGGVFHVLDYIPAGQDWYVPAGQDFLVMQKPTVGAGYAGR